MNSHMKPNIDQLIRDLIVEDQFKAKYTKRQRSIFCKNMYRKISTFLRNDPERIQLKCDLSVYMDAYYALKNQHHIQTIKINVFFSILYIYTILTVYYNLYLYVKSRMQLCPQETQGLIR